MLRRLFRPFLLFVRPFYITDPCLTPPSSCHNWVYESLTEQRWLLLQLLNALLTSPVSLDTLKSDAQTWICQGSPSKLRMLQAQLVGSNLSGVVTAQPVCWTPLEIEGAIAFLTCKLLNQVAPQIL